MALAQTTAIKQTLALGVAVPLLYYLAQLLAAPFFPGYSFLIHTASDLGSQHSSFPLFLNGGAVLSGLAALVAAWGLARGLFQLKVHWVLAWIIGLDVGLVGLSNMWVGFFPLPDPRHAANPLTPALLLLPLLMLITLWKPSSVSMKIYWIINLLLFVALAAIFSGSVAFDRSSYEGLLQRVLAFTVFVHIAVASFYLRRLL
jgi:hypothetical membrane protein